MAIIQESGSPAIANLSHVPVAYLEINPRYRYATYQDITVVQETDTGRLNATLLCSAEGRRFEQFLQTQAAQELLTLLRATIPETDLMHTVLDGPEETMGNYVHEDITLQAAKWCSPGMERAISKIIDDQVVSIRIAKEKAALRGARRDTVVWDVVRKAGNCPEMQILVGTLILLIALVFWLRS